jgi:hypothetical protein
MEGADLRIVALLSIKEEAGYILLFITLSAVSPQGMYLSAAKDHPVSPETRMLWFWKVPSEKKTRKSRPGVVTYRYRYGGFGYLNRARTDAIVRSVEKTVEQAGYYTSKCSASTSTWRRCGEGEDLLRLFIVSGLHRVVYLLPSVMFTS